MSQLLPDTLAEFIQAVRDVIEDAASGILDDNDTDLTPNILSALQEHAEVIQLKAMKDVVGDGITDEFDLTTFTGWIQGLSAIVSIESPIDGKPPIFLKQREFRVFDADPDSDGFIEDTLQVDPTPADGKTMRVVFTTEYTINGLESAIRTSIRRNHLRAFLYLAAAHALEEVARHQEEHTDSMVDEDLISHGDESTRWSAMAKTLRSTYRKMLGRETKTATGVSDVIDYRDATDLDPIGDRIATRVTGSA